MKLIARRGETSKKIRVFLQDTLSTTGAGLAGLTATSSGLTANYHRDGDAAATAIPLTAGTLGTWSAGGFVAVDSTTMPGLYELGLPDTALNLTGSGAVIIYLKGDANMVPCLTEIELISFDLQAAAQVFPANFSSLVIGIGGTVDANVTQVNGDTASVSSAVAANVTQWNGVAIAAPDAAGYPKVTIKSGTAAGEISLAGGNLAGSVASVAGNVAGSVASVAAGVTVADRTGFKLAPDGLDAISAADPGAPDNHTTISRMLVAVWRSIYRKSTLSTTQLKMYADDGTTIRSTQLVSDDGVVQTRGAAF